MDAVKKTKEDMELEEAMSFIDELHRDPVKLERWVETGWSRVGRKREPQEGR